MSGDQYFRHNLHYGHTFWNLRPGILDFFKISTSIFVNFTITACMHLTLTAPFLLGDLLYALGSTAAVKRKGVKNQNNRKRRDRDHSK